ncbi:MAG: serine/threonine protein kinase [Rubrobacter sp.]|nr:serine/threonine protein kinase [Rubrobacter sp.]
MTLDTSVGTVLGGRYRVQNTLGAGGMAVVYRAEDVVLSRSVALKMLHRRYAEDTSFRVRFEQEARVMASLDHENIVRVYDISQDGEFPFIVAEYVSGQDVGSVLKSTPGERLNEQVTLGIVTQLLRALDYAHQRGIIHRDIKPSNILITRENIVKVADFGIARVVEDEEVGEPGEIIGSARYMSPEQLKGEETTPRSDLYSVGILLYHCLTGRPPFSGATHSVARQQMHKEPTPPRELNKAISPHLEAVILKALAKDPRDRYSSASAMLESLRGGARVKDFFVKAARRSPEARKALLAFSMLALLFLGGGTAVASLGYVGLPDQLGQQLTSAEAVRTPPPALPVEEESPEVPQTLRASREPEQNAALPEEPPPVAFAPVPNVDAYFDFAAQGILASSGFQTEFVYGYREGYAAKGVVWGADPGAGTWMPVGSTIVLYATPRDQPQIPPSQPLQPQIPAQTRS